MGGGLSDQGVMSKVMLVKFQKPYMQQLVQLGGVAGCDHKYLMQPLPSMLEARSNFGLIYLKGCHNTNKYSLFAVGGRSNEGLLSSIERYDSATKSWSIVAHLSQGLEKHQVVSLPDGIYVIGGKSDEGYLSTVLKLDPATLQFQSLPSLHQERANFRAVLSTNC